MNEKIECACGCAHIEYVPFEEEEDAYNTHIKSEKYGAVCICRSCGNAYDNYDKAMVRYINTI